MTVGYNVADYQYDLRKEDERERAIAHAFGSNLGLDTLIYNAAVNHHELTAHHGHQEFLDILAVNVVGFFQFSQAFIKARHHEWREGRGREARVVATTSMITQRATRGSVGYAASKAAMESMVRTMALECAAGPSAMSFFGVAPGMIDETGMMRSSVASVARREGISLESAEEYILQYNPLGRFATVEEVWSLFDFAVNEAPTAATGSIFRMPAGTGL